MAARQKARWFAVFVVGGRRKARCRVFSSPLAAVVWVGEAQARAGVRPGLWRRTAEGGLASEGYDEVGWAASVQPQRY